MKLTNRQVASKAGETRYFTGNLCPRGHRAERMVSTRACTECMREKKHAWSVANTDKVNAQKRSWRERNLEHARALNLANQKLHRDSANERNRRYAAAHREELRARNAAYQKAHPEIGAAKTARYLAAKRKQLPTWADQGAIDMIYRAAEVIRTTGFEVHVDHIVPLQGKNVSGLHVHNNLRIIQANANRMKSNQFEGAIQ